MNYTLIIDQFPDYAMCVDCFTALGPDGARWAAVGLLTLLCCVAGLVVSSIDPEVLEIYVSEAALLVLTVAIAAVALGTMITIGPIGLGLH